jgi:outer membrane biogenesis lipoprotein LolB
MRSTVRKTQFGLATLSALLLTGCATTTATVATNAAACDVWKPVSWSVRDTDQTIREAKVNNARRTAWCKG